MSAKVTKIGNDSKNRSQVSLDLSKLEVLQTMFQTKFVAQIGILGSKTNRLEPGKGESHSSFKKRVRLQKESIKSGDASSMTNAEIGLIHEKGSVSRHIPRRSFLEVPLRTQIKTNEIKAIAESILNSLANSISVDTMINVYKRLGALGERVVLQAFNSKGYGQWPDNSPATIRRKGSSNPLIDTAQLRRSITSRVVTK